MLQLYNPTNLSKILLSCHFSMSPLWLLVAHALYLSVCVSKENYISKIYPKFIRSYPLMIIEKTITQISNKWFAVSLERFVPFYCAVYRSSSILCRWITPCKSFNITNWSGFFYDYTHCIHKVWFSERTCNSTVGFLYLALIDTLLPFIKDLK